MVKLYTPSRGDVALVATAGKGVKQPVFVVTPKEYNHKTGTMFACPIAALKKGHPFEVFIKTKDFTGYILTDHMQVLDFSTRKAELLVHASAMVTQSVQKLIMQLVIG